MNVAAVYLGLSCLFRPSLLRPSLVYEEFSDIPSNLSDALSHAHRARHGDQDPKIDIRAIVLDKDNCFAAPHQQHVWPAYMSRWGALRRQFPGKQVLIVSNSAGSSDDAGAAEARILSDNLKTDVLVHTQKKPACGKEVMQALTNASIGITHSSQVVIVGDRLFTDVLMANLMGCHSIWLRRGTVADFGIFSKFEKSIYNILH